MMLTQAHEFNIKWPSDEVKEENPGRIMKTKGYITKKDPATRGGVESLLICMSGLTTPPSGEIYFV